MNTMTNKKSYSELIKLKTFKERFDYLKMSGLVGDLTFNGHRYLNQVLYNCAEWKSVRRIAIIRDEGCDLGIPDRQIYGKILVHHINPITIDDVLKRKSCVFDLDNLISTAHETHNAIHYGDESSLPNYTFAIRKPNDTCPWR